MEVRVGDDVPNALTSLLAERMEAASRSVHDPGRLARGGCVSVRAADIGLTTSIALGPNELVVRNGKDPRADVRIRASASDLMELADSPAILGVPNPFRKAGRRALWAILRGRIRMRGALRHPLVATRFARLLAV